MHNNYKQKFETVDRKKVVKLKEKLERIDRTTPHKKCKEQITHSDEKGIKLAQIELIDPTYSKSKTKKLTESVIDSPSNTDVKFPLK